MNTRPPINPPAQNIGRLNVVLTGTARAYQVDDFEGSLSIKTVARGAATWRAAGRRFAVNENCWLVLNDRQHYSMEIASREPTTTFCLFFERGFVEDIWRTLITPASELLDKLAVDGASAGFFEALEPKQSAVLRKVRKFQRAVSGAEITSDEWEEWFIGIGATLVTAQRDLIARAEKLPALKGSTRMELCRRVLRGRDVLLSSTNGSVPLNLLAREACMSPYHFHRTFRQLFGMTPHALLTHHRLQRAAEGIQRSEDSISDICFQNGFESLPSFSSLFRKRFGVSPREFRRRNGRVAEIRKIE
jgi:AraC family transcriptional regulator